MWPSWGTDLFGWKEGLGFRLVRSVLSLAELAGNFHPTEMSWWGGGEEWAFFPPHETKPYIFFCKTPFYLNISVYTPVLKLCTPPLYGYSVYYLLFSYHWMFILFPQFCNQSALVHSHLCKNIFEQKEVFPQDRFLEVASMDQGDTCFKFI